MIAGMKTKVILDIFNKNKDILKNNSVYHEKIVRKLYGINSV
jgi:hypothetical protein